jgi:hypothetical protein
MQHPDINKFERYQKDLKVEHLFPPLKGLCACGCGQPLGKRRRRWATDACRRQAVTIFFILKGNAGVIREELYKRDKGICALCGTQRKYAWHADHIIAVALGGGGCTLSNYQTLCKKCHLKKSYTDLGAIATRRELIRNDC